MYKFDDIIGHKNQLEGLKKTIKNHRINHAYLFYGPEGIGKKTIALAFAAAIFCDHARETGACGCCHSCRQIINNNHPDLFQIYPQGASIKIEQIREIKKKASYKPYQNKSQIFILEAAETMTMEAANCFLKTLEDPPGQAVFILISTNPDLLPLTVVSRCQLLSFKELNFEEIVRGLVILTGISTKEAQLPALMAQGSLGKALTYITDNAPVKLRDRIIKLSKIINQGLILELLDEVSFLAENKNSALKTIEMLLLWYRDLLIWQESSNKDILFNKDRFQVITDEAGHYTTGFLLKALERLETAKSNLLFNGNPRLVLDVLLLDLARFREGSSEHAI
ncbi:DNA polymerase III subunit delta' [Desulfolucanica intricata]|uniref:DNA polymerase III subunit delta' n=1 Tax=Desulfolucanica intricata TaxID=1285191 RepID=UPI00082B985E|nr:DNA polymerase III subunit delta' [Desulfolucanica intricata]